MIHPLTSRETKVVHMIATGTNTTLCNRKTSSDDTKWTTASGSSDCLTCARRTTGYTAIVTLCGNPDHGQDPDQPPPGRPRHYVINHHELIELKADLVNWRRHDLGGGNWKGCALLKDGQHIGRLSWNLRTWGHNGEEIEP